KLKTWFISADDDVQGMGGSAGISAAHGIQAWLRAFDRSATAISGSAAQLGSDAANQTGNSADMVDGMIGLQLAAAGVKAHVDVARVSLANRRVDTKARRRAGHDQHANAMDA